jgi:predicted phosphodiesterase
VNVLALYDIHGNVDALEAVLADPRAANPDVVLVGGDAVPGAFCVATLDRLDRLPTRWVRGNGEREVAAALDTPPADDPAGITSAASAQELGERARPLGALPLTVEIDGVLYCHATPRSDEEILTRFSPPEAYAEALEGVTHSVVIAGHTHQQDDRSVGDIRFLNAGSVGMPYEGDGAARWLWIADGVPQAHSTAYEAHATGTRMLEAGWPDARSINASLIEPLAASEITDVFEARRAQPAS